MDDLSGPVGIVPTITQVGTASETIAAAVENILYFGAMLAVNLAVMNMPPSRLWTAARSSSSSLMRSP